MAAGLSLPEANLAAFVERINAYASLSDEDFTPRVHIDVPMPLSYVTKELVQELQVLEPFGKGNGKPVFADRDIRVVDRRIVGKNKNVLKMVLEDGMGNRYPGVYFGDVEEFLEFLDKKDVVSVVYYPEINRYMGRDEVQFVISNYC